MISSSKNKKRKSMSLSPLMEDERSINWAELPPELISSILLRVGMFELLRNTQGVCRSWRRVCKDPSMWRKIHMRGAGRVFSGYYRRLCLQAVNLSQGGLLDISIGDFCTDYLLTYIADRSSKLRSLAFQLHSPVTNEGLVNAIAKLPLIKTLEISHSFKRKLNLKDIGQACPQLKTFKLINASGFVYFFNRCDDDDAYALDIAENMPQLRHLQLLGNTITDTGLNSILEKLPHLQHLDLRMCLNIKYVGNLERRCLERIKELRRPFDSIADYPFQFIFPGDD